MPLAVLSLTHIRADGKEDDSSLARYTAASNLSSLLANSILPSANATGTVKKAPAAHMYLDIGLTAS
jgi:hypothetical protein